MSHEFYQIMVGSPSMSIHGWKQLALWSLEYSCLSAKEIERCKEIFLQSWEAFCNDVVKEYSALGFFKQTEFVLGKKLRCRGGKYMKDENGKVVISDLKVRKAYGMV